MNWLAWLLFQILEEMLLVAGTAAFALATAMYIVDGVRLVTNLVAAVWMSWSEPSWFMALFCVAAGAAAVATLPAAVEVAALVIALTLAQLRERAVDRGVVSVACATFGGLVLAAQVISIVGVSGALLLSAVCAAVLLVF